MKKRKKLRGTSSRSILYSILCAILCGLLLTSCAENDKETEEEPETESAIKFINLQDYTELEVLIDCTSFTPAAQDQSYNPETDVNPGCKLKGWQSVSKSTDSGDVVYISTSEKRSLFAFQKESASAGIACNRPDCEHDMSVKGDCQANLYVLDANISGMQYYNNDFYYTLSGGGATILYKTSSDHEIKSQYTMLLGEKGYGVCTGWLIHRGSVYFFVKDDGFYKMSVDNPSNKEKLIDLSKDDMSSRQLLAEGSYIYFGIQGDHKYAIARYNIESNQIEQFMDIEEIFYDFVVHDQKIYYIAYLEENGECVLCQYDVAAGKNEIFLRGEDKNFNTVFYLIHGDSDYIYLIKEVIKKGDYYDEEELRDISCFAYTWDGNVAGEILNTEDRERSRKLEAFKVFHHEETELIGTDSDRIYYISIQCDTQVQENGVIEEPIEGTEKTVISYINKSEISAETAAPVHIAGEIYD